MHQYLLCQWLLKDLKCWDFYRLGFNILTKRLKPNTAIQNLYEQHRTRHSGCSQLLWFTLFGFIRVATMRSPGGVEVTCVSVRFCEPIKDGQSSHRRTEEQRAAHGNGLVRGEARNHNWKRLQRLKVEDGRSEHILSPRSRTRSHARDPNVTDALGSDSGAHRPNWRRA